MEVEEGQQQQPSLLLQETSSSLRLEESDRSTALTVTTKRRAECSRCERPLRVCLCPSLPPDAPLPLPQLRVIVLVHEEEAKANKQRRTVPILAQIIGETTSTPLCTIYIGSCLIRGARYTVTTCMQMA